MVDYVVCALHVMRLWPIDHQGCCRSPYQNPHNSFTSTSTFSFLGFHPISFADDYESLFKTSLKPKWWHSSNVNIWDYMVVTIDQFIHHKLTLNVSTETGLRRYSIFTWRKEKIQRKFQSDLYIYIYFVRNHPKTTGENSIRKHFCTHNTTKKNVTHFTLNI